MNRSPILSQAEFVKHVGDRLELDLSQRGQQDFAEIPLDSFHLMELVAAIDDLAVVLDEEVYERSTTLFDLYDEYLREAVQQDLNGEASHAVY